jgi:hypothetical protein
MEMHKDGWLLCIFASQILVNQPLMLISSLPHSCVLFYESSAECQDTMSTLPIREIYPELPSAVGLGALS